MLQASLLSTKEPAGLFRTDFKRPYGLTNVFGQADKSAV